MKLTWWKVVLFSVVLLLASGLFGLLISELVIRKFLPQVTFSQAKLKMVPIFAESDYLPFTLAKGVAARHVAPSNEFDVEVSVNEQGYRGDGFDTKKPENSYRILFVGDSMTFGIGARDNETFEVILVNKLNDWAEDENFDKEFEVINAGFVGGFSPDTFYAFLKNEGLELKPDLVVVNLLIANDFSDMLENDWVETDGEGLPVKIESKAREVSLDKRLVFRNMDWKYKFPILRSSHLAILVMNYLEANDEGLTNALRGLVGAKKFDPGVDEGQSIQCLYLDNCNQATNELWNKTERLLVGIDRLADQAGAEAVVAIIPAPFQVTQDQEPVERDNRIDIVIEDPEEVTYQPQKRLVEMLNNRGVEYLNLLPQMRRVGSDAYLYPLDGHLTAQGHERAAEIYFEWLREKLMAEKAASEGE